MKGRYKLKNFKSKLENFWYYHKWATILTIFFAIGIIQLVTYRNDTIPQDCEVAVVAGTYVCNEQINFDELVKDKIVDINEDGIYSVNVGEFIIGNNPSSDQTSIQQILASFSSGDTGLYIFDKVNLDRFMQYDAFAPLDHNILSKDVIAERSAFSKDGRTYAVSLAGCGLIENYNFKTDDLYAAVIFDRPEEDIDAKTLQSAENAKVILKELLK